MLPEKADELNCSKVPTTMEPVFVTEREGLADGRQKGCEFRAKSLMPEMTYP